MNENESSGTLLEEISGAVDVVVSSLKQPLFEVAAGAAFGAFNGQFAGRAGATLLQGVLPVTVADSMVNGTVGGARVGALVAGVTNVFGFFGQRPQIVLPGIMNHYELVTFFSAVSGLLFGLSTAMLSGTTDENAGVVFLLGGAVAGAVAGSAICASDALKNGGSGQKGMFAPA